MIVKWVLNLHESTLFSMFVFESKLFLCVVLDKERLFVSMINSGE